ncbi:MAG: transporter substrate-binding domain-containing protein [Actinomycetota bacterium]|nr:transporter substrate-binding domain-containing protein [Actinomycetota bacterium]
MFERWWPSVLVVVLVAAWCTGCDFPRDSEGTLERVRGGTMRVGLAINEPWTRMEEDRASGVEVTLVSMFADELRAEPVFVQGTVPELLEAIKENELDVVIGGLTEDSPGAREQTEAALTRAYLTTRPIVGVPPSQVPFDDLSGRKVGVERIDRTAAELRKRGAIPVQTEDLSAAKGPIAAYPWQIEEWGFKKTGIELPEEQHVMAVPLGENGWLVRLERFLHAHRDEAERLLRKEAAR